MKTEIIDNMGVIGMQKQCANPSCGDYFTTHRLNKNKKFCSKRCGRIASLARNDNNRGQELTKLTREQRRNKAMNDGVDLFSRIKIGGDIDVQSLQFCPFG